MKKNLLFIIKINVILISLLLLTLMLLNIFKLEIFNNITENQIEYFKFLIDTFFNLLLLLFLIITEHIRGLSPVLNRFIEVFQLLLEGEAGSLTNYLAENNINNFNSDTLSETETITESEQGQAGERNAGQPEWKNLYFLADNQTDNNSENNSQEINKSSNSNKKTPLTLEEEEEELDKFLYEKGPKPSS
jgi:hypothetical protein